MRLEMEPAATRPFRRRTPRAGRRSPAAQCSGQERGEPQRRNGGSTIRGAMLFPPGAVAHRRRPWATARAVREMLEVEGSVIGGRDGAAHKGAGAASHERDFNRPVTDPPKKPKIAALEIWASSNVSF